MMPGFAIEVDDIATVLKGDLHRVRCPAAASADHVDPDVAAGQCDIDQFQPNFMSRDTLNLHRDSVTVEITNGFHFGDAVHLSDHHGL